MEDACSLKREISFLKKENAIFSHLYAYTGVLKIGTSKNREFREIFAIF